MPNLKLVFMYLFLVLHNLMAEELPLIPLESAMLQEKVEDLNLWKKKTSVASKLPYYSSQAQTVALDQYLMNAKIFMIKNLTQSLFFPIGKLELNFEIFQTNFFAFTKKYCEIDPRTDFDWGSLTRQLFLQAKKNIVVKRWDDHWSKGNFPIEIQQKLYTARITKSLDAIKALCLKEDEGINSLTKFFLKDDIISIHFTNFMKNKNNPKFFCESSLFCRELVHDEFIKRLPRSILDFDFEQEMINLWKTSIENYAPNWVEIKKKYSYFSSFSTDLSRLNLRDELLGLSDFFIFTNIMTKNSNSLVDDPILKSVKPFIDQLVTLKLNLAAAKVTWEEPLEITIDHKPLNISATSFIMDIKASRGGFDQMIDVIEKFRITDQLEFDRGFMEWFLRATLRITYYDEQLYWMNVESIQQHLSKRFEAYIKKRKSVMPYLSYNKKLPLVMTKWFIENRNEIAELVTKNPEINIFPLTINHYLGLSALETRFVEE